MAKMHTGGDEIVAMRGSWVGQTFGARSLTFNGKVRKGYGPLMPGSIYPPYFKLRDCIIHLNSTY